MIHERMMRRKYFVRSYAVIRRRNKRKKGERTKYLGF